jgi:folate-binding protein YgfZ
MASREHFGNPMIEQRELVAGKAIVDLGPRGIITVAGEDRLSWLHSLLSQNLKNIAPGVSSEALLLDPQGHLEQVIHFLDDGETSWLVVEESSRQALLDWLGKMVFRMKVQVLDRSAEFAVLGSFGKPIPQAFESNGIAITWHDPWPGVVEGGYRYGTGKAQEYDWYESVVLLEEVPKVFVERTESGTMAAEAIRIAGHRPRQLFEVDDRSLPHELDWLSTAVHLNKGCYRGQESVAKIHNLGHPPRRLTFLHLDGSGHDIPNPGDEIFLPGEDKPRGKITSTQQHYEMGPIALALLQRTVPEDSEVLVRTKNGDIAATQEVIVPATAGKTVTVPKLPRLKLGNKN